MRLIDADALIRKFKTASPMAIDGRARQIVDDMPTIDAVEVVRCKDCKYCLSGDEYELWCNGFCSPARLVRADDFCSHGKSKNEVI